MVVFSFYLFLQHQFVRRKQEKVKNLGSKRAAQEQWAKGSRGALKRDATDQTTPPQIYFWIWPLTHFYFCQNNFIYCPLETNDLQKIWKPIDPEKKGKRKEICWVTEERRAWRPEIRTPKAIRAKRNFQATFHLKRPSFFCFGSSVYKSKTPPKEP